MTERDNTFEDLRAEVMAERRRRYVEEGDPRPMDRMILEAELAAFDRRLKLLEDIIKNAWNAGRL